MQRFESGAEKLISVKTPKHNAPKRKCELFSSIQKHKSGQPLLCCSGNCQSIAAGLVSGNTCVPCALESNHEEKVTDGIEVTFEVGHNFVPGYAKGDAMTILMERGAKSLLVFVDELFPLLANRFQWETQNQYNTKEQKW